MIEFSFKHSKGGFKIDMSGEIPGQGVTAIFGPSGCGKTTFLRALSGLEKVPGGSVSVNGSVWQGNSFKAVHERALGFVFQEGSLFPHLTVKKNLEFAYKRTPESRKTIKFDETVDLMGLKIHLEKYPDQLSGGERQRTAIARALLTSPELLILDEPLTGLDTKSKNEILPYLERLVSQLKIPAIYVSHDIGEVARLADHVLLMDNGKISAQGTVQEVFNRLDLPPAQSADAESIIETKVLQHDDEYHLSTLKFSGGEFIVSKVNQPEGSAVRLRILAKGVSLTLQKPRETSILNIFPVEVKEVTDIGKGQLNVLLDADGTAIISRITKKSGQLLGIEPGLKVFAQIKSVELLV
ncbi:MAG: molybdenum ABC transporter ATP-binding protein [Lentisphaeraceae bacterium]|nr:molybdenum ABC transporter ATP-binding protein [Lentisphaeraceae bacterium]